MKNFDIFISYRRQGGYDTAKHLNDLLVRDGYRVSFDIDTLRNGDFDVQLLNRIDQCEDFILIVDEKAFERTLDVNFNPQKDWLRNKLAYALAKNKNIIPVFLSGVKGFPEGLPSDVSGVVKKNGPEYNRYYFNEFYDVLKERFIKSKPVRFSGKWILAACVLIVMAAILFFMLNSSREPKYNEETSKDASQIIDNNVDIIFYGKADEGLFYNNLYAKVDGYEYKIDIPSDMCMDIVAQEDFDGDGIKDALIENIQACGGNAIGSSFFFVKYTGTGFFTITNEFGNNVNETPKIERWNGKLSVLIIDCNEGYNTERNVELRERFVLQQGRAVRVESSKKNSITTIKEISVQDFHNGKENETISMTYDLDGNGIMDQIDCTYWDRWDALLFNITVNGKQTEYHTGYSRIGITENKTNGFHDLICGDNTIYRWSGEVYEEKEERKSH